MVRAGGGGSLTFGFLLVAILAQGLAGAGAAHALEELGHSYPHSCSRHDQGGVLLEEVPSDATVMDLVWIGQMALGDETRAMDLDRRVTVGSGDTFLGLLRDEGVSHAEGTEWYRASREVFNLGLLRPGHSLSMSFDEAQNLVGIEYEISKSTLFLAERGEDGQILARRAEIPTKTEIRGVAGRLTTNIAADCAAADVPRRVVRQLVDIFRGEVDFRRMRRGDAFRLLYEVKITEDGKPMAHGSRVVAAEVEMLGKTHTALRANAPRGGVTYVDLKGLPLQSASSLHYPVKFTRISSHFSHSRVHPKTGRRRPHLGVDFAAPRGTPVHAVADGRVEVAGWYGQLGRTVRIDHGGKVGFDSLYGHLTRVAGGVKRGKFVKRGQIIGYVGSTGLATGPHLHFSLIEGKRFVDPMKALRKAQYIDPVPLSGDRFEKRKTVLVSALGALDGDGPVEPKGLADVRDL